MAVSTKSSAAPRGRKKASGSGATRKVQAAQSSPKRSLNVQVWLNRGIILCGLGVVFVACAQAYLFLQSIPVEQITVTGKLEHTRKEVVQDMVQPALVGGFLSADLERVRAQLQELPWIYDVSVRRRWPNALEINVVEQLPIARWGESGFLNHEGEVFQSDNASRWSELPRLSGPGGSAKPLVAKYQKLLEALAPVSLKVASLAVDERGQLEAKLQVGMTLVVGGQHFRERLQRFVSIYRSDLAGQVDQVERVDLRYESGLAVTFRPLPEEQEETAAAVAGL